MKYLIRGKGIGLKAVAHYWDGIDTYCRMWSTGGLNKRKYGVHDETQLPICTMCTNAIPSGRKP